MELQIKISSDIVDLWRLLAKEDKFATFFQTMQWHELAAKYFKAESVALVYQWGSQKAILPLVRQKKGWLYHYFSPFGTYTNLISPFALSNSQKRQVNSHLRKLDISLFSSPFGNNQVYCGPRETMETYIVPLRDLRDEKIEKAWRKGHRDNYRMSQKKGVQVREANNRSDLEAYWSLYQKTLHRWGNEARTRYSYNLFQEIWTKIVPTHAGRLWLATHDQQIIYGVIVFYHNLHSVAWHSASSHSHSKLYPSQAIYHHIMRHAKKNGYQYFDFNPSKGMPGVIQFKLGFGARASSFHSSSHQSPLLRFIRRLKKNGL